MVLSTVLRIIYTVLLAIITLLVGWHGFKTDKIYEKITAAIMLIVLVLRILYIK